MKKLFLCTLLLFTFFLFIPLQTTDSQIQIPLVIKQIKPISSPKFAQNETEPASTKTTSDDEEKEPDEEEEPEEEVEEEKVEEPEEVDEPKEEPEEAEEPEEEKAEEGLISPITEKIAAATAIFQPSVIINKILTLLQTSAGKILTGPVSSAVAQMQKMKKEIEENFNNGFMNIPKIGTIKFKQLTEEQIKKYTEKPVPRMIGTFYDVDGKTIKKLQIGPIKIDSLKIIITEQQIPLVDCDVTFFKNKGKLTQKTVEEGGITFLLTFEKPFMIPTGLKSRAAIQNFEVKISADRRFAQTTTRLFGTKTEEPSTITLDLTQIPFTFKVISKNIPITAISPNLKGTPLKNIKFPNLSLNIIPVPPSIKFSGTADMGDLKIGTKGKIPMAKVSASLGAEGFYFIFNLENLSLPLNIGTINKAQLRIGTPS